MTGPFDIQVDPTRMSAYLVRPRRPAEDQAAPSLEEVLQALKAKKVTFGVDEGAIRRALADLAAGRPVPPQITVAQGQAALPGADARLELKAAGALVRPGEQLACLHPAQAGTPGVDVHGRKVKTPEGRARRLSVGVGAQLSPNGQEAVATTLGLFQVKDHHVSVTALIELSADGMEASLRPPPLGTSAVLALDVATVQAALSALGVVQGLDRSAIETCLAQAAAGQANASIEPQVVARGQPALPGADGHIEWHCRTLLHAGTERPDGAMDFHQRGFGETMCTASQVMAVIVPPGKGQPGVNLKGEVLPAPDGRPVDLQTGEGVERSPDGLSFRALRNGRATFVSGLLQVHEFIVIPGDVDYSTGHVEAPQAGIEVGGDVLAQFRVSGAGPVVVRGTIGDAQVHSANAIVVGRGIVQGDSGEVRAGTTVEALFAQHARIHAGGDVTIKGGIIDCTIQAGGRILATGPKGRIAGGSAQGAGGIEATDVGSKSEVATRLVVDQAEATVRIAGVAHPGVRVEIGGELRLVTETIRAVEFYLDRGKQVVANRGLT